MGIVLGNMCFVIFDLGRIVLEVHGLFFRIKVSFCFALSSLFIELCVLGEDSEEVDIKDWSEEEEVSLDGGWYVGDGKVLGLVF